MIRVSDEHKRALKRLGKPVLIGVLLLLNIFAVWNFVLLSRDLLYGDRSADNLLVRPTYRPRPIKDTPITEARKAVGRVGADFAQVYFPAQDAAHLQNAFDSARTLDPWSRPSRYAPAVELACAVTLCRVDFGLACALNIVVQLLLFYGVCYWLFRQLGLQQYLVAALLFFNVLLFLTPTGLSWYERGQFSLYLAASYPLLLVGLLKKQWPAVVAGAALAFIKWTSFPAIFVILVVYLLSSRNLKELKSNVILASIFGVTAIALLVLPALFAQGAEAFVRGAVTQELTDVPAGITLLRYMPRAAVKLLPLAAILLGYVGVRSSPALQDWLVPYAAGAVVVMLVYPTRAYEYGLPSILGFIPLMLYWARQSDGRTRVMRQVLVWVFLLFTVVASVSTRLVSSLAVLVQLYVVISLVLMLAPVLLALARRPKPELGPVAKPT